MYAAAVQHERSPWLCPQSVVRAVRFAPGRPDQLRSCGLDQRLLLHDRRLDAAVAVADAGVPLTALSCRHDGLMAVGTAGVLPILRI